jgi:hypothetical protein
MSVEIPDWLAAQVSARVAAIGQGMTLPMFVEIAVKEKLERENPGEVTSA